MSRTESRSAVSLPPVTLTPEEAAAVALALATRPTGSFAEAGRSALDKVLHALEPDPRRRAQLLAMAGQGVSPVGGHPTHPAGRTLRGRQPAPRPRLVVLPGGRA